jgi:hypothetical protein
MNCFQLIKTVLDEAYADIPGAEPEKDNAIKEQMDLLSAEYSKLRVKGCLDYSHASRRFAYLFTYTTSHANIVYERIRASKPLREIFERKDVTVSCIGGGPGSDFLGVLKYCEHAEKRPYVTCHLLDRDSAWGESWSDVGKKVSGTLSLTTHFNPFDVTVPEKWKIFKKHFQADLFTLIYFMSEVFALRAVAGAYFDALFEQMKPGALLLFVDNNNAEFYGWFDDLAKKHGLKVLDSAEGMVQMPLREEKRDLEPYRSRLKRNPKLDANIAWRVVQK